MSSMLNELGKALEVQEKAPVIKRRKRTPAEKLEAEKKSFCNAARRILVQVDKKKKAFELLFVNPAYTNTTAVQNHMMVLEKLRVATEQAKDAFECGD